MSHTYSANFAHLVFSTKERKDLIPPELQSKLFAYLGGTLRKLGSTMLTIGGTPNHVHILIKVPPTARLAEIVQKVKGSSSHWLGKQGVTFEWQQGYGAFSVSPSMLSTVQAYIEGQEEHHRKRNYEAEFLVLLRKSGVHFNPREALG